MADVQMFTSKAAVIRFARQTVGGLGNPSKMPGFAYGLPPAFCRTGSKLRELDGTPCSDCYACKGRYTTTDGKGNPGSVAIAQANRYATLSNLQEWRQNFVTVLRNLTAITPKHERFFRWHDAGDVQSVEHLQAIVWIAEQLPEWSFWLPTQEHADVRTFLRSGGVLPSNLCVRESSPKLGVPVNASTGSSSYVEPSKAAFLANANRCTAYENGGECGACRRCWNPQVAVVVYPQH